MTQTQTPASELQNMFAELENCCLHDPQWTPAEVTKELAWLGDRATKSNSESLVIVQLASGFGLLTQSEDYSGHGCCCGSMTVREPTLPALLEHLTPGERELVAALI